MTYTKEKFNKFCFDATGQFLQTVVVIDNEAVFCETPCKIVEGGPKDDVKGDDTASTIVINVPSGGVLGGQTNAPPITQGSNVSFPSAKEDSAASEHPEEVKISNLAEAASEEVEGQVRRTETAPFVDKKIEGAVNLAPQHAAPPKQQGHKNILKAKPLIDAFADKGVVCSIIRPDATDDMVIERAVAVSSAADIVVVDWALGKNIKAQELIRGILERDIQRQGRLRLIAVYTAEPNPGNILDDLETSLAGLPFSDEIKKIDSTFCLQNKFLKIIVLLKPAAGDYVPGNPPVDFGALPDKLQELFAEMNSGILPSAALRSIAAIREGTHHLLAVLHKGLDPALVGHRCLIPYPEDAEEFCEELVAGEIRSILSLAQIGAENAGERQSELWVASRHEAKDPLTYKEEYAIKRSQISSLIKKGDQEHKAIFRAIKKERNDRLEKKDADAPFIKIHEIPQILHGDEAGGIQINREFSRLTSFKREAFGPRKPIENWVPRLTLGTLLQRQSDNGLFLCLQPRCESVRLSKDERRVFPFLGLGKGKTDLFLVVNIFNKAKQPEEIETSLEAKPKNQAVFEFQSTTSHTISAEKDGHCHIFTDVDGVKFYWLGDLKDPLAQNIAGKMSDVVGSVGINPYEWQRLKAD